MMADVTDVKTVGWWVGPTEEESVETKVVVMAALMEELTAAMMETTSADSKVDWLVGGMDTSLACR